MNNFIANLKKDIEQYCNDFGRHEPDTNAFVFDSPHHESFYEGMEHALELAKTLNNQTEDNP